MAKKKSEKNPIENKSVKKESIDWNKQPTMVEIIFKGKKTRTHKSNAKLLIESAAATLA